MFEIPLATTRGFRLENSAEGVQERWEQKAPLGLLFWDPALDRPVTADLVVTLRSAPGDGPPMRAVVTGSNVYTFHKLPAAGELVLEVSDPNGRFFPLRARLSPPGVEAKGTLRQIYLVSAPTRQPAPGLAVVRGYVCERCEQPEGRPAAFALIAAQVGGSTWYGVADERGCFALLFPYPVANGSLDGHGPSAHFELTVRVHYGALKPPPSGARRRAIPDWQAILSQPPGALYPTREGSGITAWQRTLEFGQELVLRTEGLPMLCIQQGE